MRIVANGERHATIDRALRLLGLRTAALEPVATDAQGTSCSTRSSSASATTSGTDRIIDDVQRSGVCWMGATSWHGQRIMRISVSSWRTAAEDVDRPVAAIVAATERHLSA